MSKAKFTSANIVAVLNSARQGGTYADVVKRSGTDMASSTLHSWLKRGRNDIDKEQDTAWALFVKSWDRFYIGNPYSDDKMMAEMKSALNQLERQASMPTPTHQSRTKCECGNRKKITAIACDACLTLDTLQKATA